MCQRLVCQKTEFAASLPVKFKDVKFKDLNFKHQIFVRIDMITFILLKLFRLQSTVVEIII